MGGTADTAIDVRVRLFAILRERAGAGEVSLTLPAGATVADALDALADRPHLGEAMDGLDVVLAVNRDYAPDTQRLAAGDELALVPPVSGGSPEADATGTEASAGEEGIAGSNGTVRVGPGPIDVSALIERVGDPGAGATVAFVGTTRTVDELEYEAYAEMARERIAAILRDCIVRDGLIAAGAEHRVGTVPRGEASVAVAVSAAHRAEAFAGARTAIDRIKAEAPIWKKEVEGAAERWVEGATPPRAEAVGDGGNGAASASLAAGAALTHLDRSGSARMVDVGDKPATERRARAGAAVHMTPASAAAALAGDGPKGDVVGTARIAGIQAAKRTAELIPLAHPVPVSWVDVDLAIDASAGTVAIEAEARTVAGTGVELEALTAASVAALTVYDMVKGVERGVTIGDVRLLEKSGGRSGHWRRDED